MKCPKCGKEIAVDRRFCESCGAKINVTVEDPKNKSRIKWGQLVLGIIGMAVGGYFMIRSSGIIGVLMLLAIIGP